MSDPPRTDLRITDLYKSFGSHPVLRGVDLGVEAGSLTAILGPSGSGKTTLLRVIGGFEHADRGTVALGGTVVDGAGAFVSSEHRRIGFVPQEGSLFPHLTVEANVGFGLERRHRRRHGARVAELLEMVGLGSMGRRYPHQLSGGQQQRVALARALAVDPQIVLLDEPFSSLDASLRASVRSDVTAVLRSAGTTAVLVTHDQDEALSIADRVAVIRDGRIGQTGTPQALYGHPADPELARFFGEINLVRGTTAGGSVQTPLGLLPLDRGGRPPGPEGADVVVMVRPEQIELTRDASDAALTGRVVSFAYYGHDAVVRVRPDRDLGAPAPAAPAPGAPELVVRVGGGARWEPASRVGLVTRGAVVAWPASGDVEEAP